MSATRYFQLEATDLEEFINPNGLSGYFAVGSGPGQVQTDKVEKTLRLQEGRVSSSIPWKYGRQLTRFEGLIGIRFAAGGETTVTLPVTPTGDVQVFKNYPSAFGNGMRVWPRGDGTLKPYRARTADDALTGWTRSEAVITLPEALEEGEHIVVDFDHAALNQCDELVLCVLELAAAETLRNARTMSESVSDKVAAWEKNAQMFLKRLSNPESDYRVGLQFFDQLKFVPEEETRISGGTRPVSPGMGQLL